MLGKLQTTEDTATQTYLIRYGCFDVLLALSPLRWCRTGRTGRACGLGNHLASGNTGRGQLEGTSFVPGRVPDSVQGRTLAPR